MTKRDPHDPTLMLVIFALLVLFGIWRAISSIDPSALLDGALSSAASLAPFALGTIAIVLEENGQLEHPLRVVVQPVAAGQRKPGDVGARRVHVGDVDRDLAEDSSPPLVHFTRGQQRLLWPRKVLVDAGDKQVEAVL